VYSLRATAKEYAFLLYAVLVAVAYGVAHDHVTATISPEYFLLGKGLAEEPTPFRWAVTLLAARASANVGLMGGAALLVANNPRRGGVPPQLSYRVLARLTFVPLAFAVVTAAAAAAVNAVARFGTATASELGVVSSRRWAFTLVWGAHAGSYAGAILGTIVSCIAVVRRRRLA
jgi:hypothetical protein